jgi:hypothetical protein
MLTIEIPKSNRRKSEEDALASFILSEIKEKGECVYFYYGVGWGNNWLIVGQKILEVTLKTDTKFRSWRTIMS